VAVSVENVSKTFRLPHQQYSTLKERALHPFRSTTYDELRAVQDISLEIAEGEFFGIVGRNGSGKSTLLKCIAGIYGVDTGRISIAGRLSPFIELGVGFNPDLPARDNAVLNATMLGLSPREARRRFDSVIDFAELQEFVDLKIKNYSSGMLVRLAFSVMIHVDAEILLIDEVLAVGDAAFQQKCYDEFDRIHSSGATVLFVTHDMSAVRRFCDRALLLEHGRTVELGDTEHVGNRYLELNFSEQARAAEVAAAAKEDSHPAAAPSSRVADAAGTPELVEPAHAAHVEPASTRYGDGRAEILEAWFEDEHGARTQALPTGRPCSFAARVRFHEEVENPLFGMSMENGHRNRLLVASNLWSQPRCGTFCAGEEVTYRVRFENILAPDRYHLTAAVARHGGAWIDRRERMISVVVTGTHNTDALLELPYEFVLERTTALPANAELVR
jgi:ABC-2 type transport system ATP-binding protein